MLCNTILKKVGEKGETSKTFACLKFNAGDQQRRWELGGGSFPRKPRNYYVRMNGGFLPGWPPSHEEKMGPLRKRPFVEDPISTLCTPTRCTVVIRRWKGVGVHPMTPRHPRGGHVRLFIAVRFQFSWPPCEVLIWSLPQALSCYNPIFTNNLPRNEGKCGKTGCFLPAPTSIKSTYCP